VKQICPVCLATYDESEVDADYPCCAECSCDMIGDIELIPIDKFLASVSVKQMCMRRALVASCEHMTDAYRNRWLGRLDELLAPKSSAPTEAK